MQQKLYEEGITMKHMIIDTTAIELPAREMTAKAPANKYSKMNKPAGVTSTIENRAAEDTSLIKRMKSETPKNWLKDNIFNISMLVLWSMTFGIALHGLTGVIVGLCVWLVVIQADDKKD